MSIIIDPPVADIPINGITITNADWEANTPGAISALGNAIAAVIADATLVGTLTKAISGNVVLSGPDSANIGFVFTGSLSADASITFAAGFSGIAQIENQTTGGYQLVCGLAAGTTVTVPVLGSAAAFCDGVNFSLQSGNVRTSTGSYVSGTFAMSGALDVVGNATIGGAIYSTGNITSAALISGNTLNAVGDATVGGALQVVGDIDGTGQLDIVGNATIGGGLSLSSGATIVGPLVVEGGAAFNGASSLAVTGTGVQEPRIVLGSAIGEYASFELDAGGGARWLFGREGTAESGGNVGSDWYITCFADDGATPVSTPIVIIRASGNIILGDLPTSSIGLTSGTLWNNGDGIVRIITG